MSENKAIQLNAEGPGWAKAISLPQPKAAAVKQWSGHPKVYLSAKPGQVVACPYCGTNTRLRRGVNGRSLIPMIGRENRASSPRDNASTSQLASVSAFLLGALTLLLPSGYAYGAAVFIVFAMASFPLWAKGAFER